MAVLLVCLLAAAYMAGLSWFVGVVHYPLFAGVGEDGWASYHRRHSDRTTLVVLGPMVAELATAAWIVADPPSGIERAPAVAGLVLAAATWALTAVAAAQHRRLGGGLDPAVHRTLLRVHHARTALWSAHAVLAAVLVASAT